VPPFDGSPEDRPTSLPRALARLQAQIVRCRLCPRLVAWREEVAVAKVRRFRNQEYWGLPVPSFGAVGASLVIVGLAPAAHGANRTGRMFTGDRSGEWLYEALFRFGFADRPVSVDRKDGLALRDCYITAAIHCAPPANKPAADELRNCRAYLCRELELLKAKRIVLALGKVAFEAFLAAWTQTGGGIPSGRKPVFRHGGEWHLLPGVVLMASYHPSQQNTQTGRLTRRMFHGILERARRIFETH
jgi:uracil-DNA glycosylase family 4